jgi:hypothetical protein
MLIRVQCSNVFISFKYLRHIIGTKIHHYCTHAFKIRYVRLIGLAIQNPLIDHILHTHIVFSDIWRIYLLAETIVQGL